MQRHPLYHSLVNLQQWEVSRKIWSIEIRPTEFHIRSSFLSASRISAPLCTLPKSWRNLGRKFARRLLWSRWRKLEYARDGWNVEEARFRLKGFAVSIQIQLSSLTAIREFFSLSVDRIRPRGDPLVPHPLPSIDRSWEFGQVTSRGYFSKKEVIRGGFSILTHISKIPSSEDIIIAWIYRSNFSKFSRNTCTWSWKHL